MPFQPPSPKLIRSSREAARAKPLVEWRGAQTPGAAWPAFPEEDSPLFPHGAP